MSALGWGDDPARYATEHARVALSSGPSFGIEGAGHARMNLACAPETIIEAVDRLSAAAGRHGRASSCMTGRYSQGRTARVLAPTNEER